MADSIKSEIRMLMQQKEGLEREIAERMARLTAPGQPGMDEPLVDNEVRHGSMACLQSRSSVHA